MIKLPVSLKTVLLLGIATALVACATPQPQEEPAFDPFVDSSMKGYDEETILDFVSWGVGLSPEETYRQDQEVFRSIHSEIGRCLRFVGRLSHNRLTENFEIFQSLSEGKSMLEVSYEWCMDGKISEEMNFRLRRWLKEDVRIVATHISFREGQQTVFYDMMDNEGDMPGLKMRLQSGIWKIDQ